MKSETMLDDGKILAMSTTTEPEQEHVAEMRRAVIGFWFDEDGSSTVEMVVMMAASVGMGIAVMDVVFSGMESLSNDISSFLSNIEISTSFAEAVPEALE